MRILLLGKKKNFEIFLRKVASLPINAKKRRRIVVKHDEAFVFVKELIDEPQLNIPFEYTNIDAHSNLGLGDSSWYHFSD